jgi:hypothetical protein
MHGLKQTNKQKKAPIILGALDNTSCPSQHHVMTLYGLKWDFLQTNTCCFEFKYSPRRNKASTTNRMNVWYGISLSSITTYEDTISQNTLSVAICSIYMTQKHNPPRTDLTCSQDNTCVGTRVSGQFYIEHELTKSHDTVLIKTTTLYLVGHRKTRDVVSTTHHNNYRIFSNLIRTLFTASEG